MSSLRQGMTGVRPAPRLSQLTCTTALLLLSSFLHAAILPSPDSSASVTSASGNSQLLNQRAVRSALIQNAGDGGTADGSEWEGKADSGCRSDFAERIMRILAGPAGHEAEAVLAAVLKLLSENERVHWKTLSRKTPPAVKAGNSGRDEDADDDDDDSDRLYFWPSSSPFHDSRPFTKQRVFTDGGVPGYEPATSGKRASPKFNPTGWRRKKRSAEPTSFQRSDVPASYQPSLRTWVNLHAAAGSWRDLPMVAESVPGFAVRPVSDVMMSDAEWGHRKRNVAEELILRRPHPQQLKRKPLEFNPTGW